MLTRPVTAIGGHWSLITSSVGEKGASRLNEEVDRMIDELLNEYYASGRKMTIDALWLELEKRIMERNNHLMTG